MIGIEPPPGMPRDCWAAWYWDQIQADPCRSSEYAGDEAHYAAQCEEVQNLITGAIEAGVSAHLIPVAGFAEPQPFHSLVAPYRRRPGGLAEREEATRQRELHRPIPRRRRAGDPA